MDDLSLPFVSRNQLNFHEATSFQLLVNLKSKTAGVAILSGATKDGPFRFQMVTLATGALQTFTFRIPDVPIWVTVTDSARGFSPGAVYVDVHLGITDNSIMCLCSGYVSGLYDISWPATNIRRNVPNSLGRLISVVSANPAAGAEVSLTVPAGVIWKIKSAAVLLSTDATVVNRTPSIIFTESAGGVIDAISNLTIGEASIVQINAAPFAVIPAAIVQNILLLPIPADIFLKEGDIIETNTANLAAGDDYDVMFLWVEEFLV